MDMMLVFWGMFWYNGGIYILCFMRWFLQRYLPHFTRTALLLGGMLLCVQALPQATEAEWNDNPVLRGAQAAIINIRFFTHQDNPNSNNCPEGTVFCGGGLTEGDALTQEYLSDDVSKADDLLLLVIGWTNFLLPIVALIAVVAIVWAGVLYVTSFGDDGRIETAKKIIMWVVIGLIIMLGAYAIVNTILNIEF